MLYKTRDKDGNIPREDRLYYRWEDEVFTKNAQFEFEYQTTFKDINDAGTKSYIQGSNSQSGGGTETHYKLIYMIEWKKYVESGKKLQSYLSGGKWNQLIKKPSF